MKGLLIILCFTVTVAFAQPGIPVSDSSQIFTSIGDWRGEIDNPDASYLYIANQMDSIVSSYPDINYEFKEWLRFENFWSTRYGYDVSEPGKLSDYPDAINAWSFQEPICPDDDVVWTNLGADVINDGLGATLNANGIVTAVYMNPANTDEIIIGTNVSGIWKTIDEGDHWECKTDDLRYPGLGIQDIIVHPTDPLRMIACTGKSTYGNTYGVGILMSIDGGETWQRNETFPYQDFPMTYQAIINPANTDEILVLTNKKLFRSLNSGFTWSVAFDLSGNPVTHDIAYDGSGNPYLQSLHKMYLSLGGVLFIGGIKRFDGATQIWKGIPGSGVWTDIRDEFTGIQLDEIQSVYFTEDGDEDIYVGLSDYDVFQIYKSTDGGNSFSFFNSGEENPEGLDKIVFSASLTGTDRIYSGSCGLFVKYASSFTSMYPSDCSLIGPYFHTDMRASQFLIDQWGNEILIVGHDGGVTVFDVTGDPSFGYNSQKLANGEGLAINQMYSISISQFTNKQLITGNQDNSSFRYDFGNEDWTKFSGGDGHETWYSSDGSGYMNCGNSDINAVGISGLSSASVSGWTLNMPVEIDEKTHAMYYRGNYYIDDSDVIHPLRLYKQDNNSTSVLTIPLGNPLRRVTEIAYCESDIKTVYFSGGVHATALTDAAALDKFFKSVDGFQTYVNISGSPVTDANGLNSMPINEAMAYRIISSIKVDPSNPDHLWVGLSGASATPWGDHRDYRCLESLDGGLTWKDYSEGLPLLPVNDLEFVKGTNGQLIAGTDVGLFIRNAEDTQWHCYQGNMPVSVITDIAIDYCDKKIYVATYGRGAWVTDLIFTPSTEYAELIVANEMEIEETYNCVSAIRILDGATLTVSGTLYMNKDTKIIVEQGGKLIINGGTITNPCGGFWSGIEVWGVTAESQLGTVQGEIVMSNGAKIEHAEVAVALWKPNDWSATGGIIRAYNSVFKNNKKDVEFISYSNDHSGTHYANKGQFTDCNFYWDNEFRTTDPLGHVTLYRVDGVKFLGCTFADKRTGSNVFISPNMVGIKSIDASYRVWGRCTGTGTCTGDIDAPGSLWDPCIFENLYFGIYATNVSTTYAINVDRCLFQDNGYGILVSAMPSPVIVRSKFEFTNLATHAFTPFTMHGIHAVNSKLLKIEENKFVDLLPGGNSTFGVVSSDLGEQEEEIRKNSFTGLTYANFTQGKNRSVSTNGLNGEVFPCNINTLNKSDHFVSNTLWDIPGSNYGVKATSGSSFMPTGTTFSADPGNLIHNEDYVNLTSLIKYWYHSSQTPNDYSLFTVQMNLSSPSTNPCLSTLTNYPGGLGKLIAGDKSAYVSQFNSTSSTLVSKENTYKNLLLDVTETTNIITAINGLTPANKTAVRNMLISYSPYLTTEVLFELADNSSTNFDHAWLRDMLLANIEAVTPQLLLFLQTKSDPLPANMLTAVSNAVGTTYTDRTVKESEISQLHTDRAFYSYQILTGFVQDTTTFNTDSLRRWVGLQNNILSQQLIIDSYLQDGNFSSAELVNDAYEVYANAGTTPSHLRLEASDFVELKNWLFPILQTPGEIASLDETKLNYLRDMALNGKGTARYQAQNILCFFYNECEYYYFEAPADTRAFEMETEQTVSTEQPVFKIYPNPASDKVMIELSPDSYGQLENAEILITDLTGKVVFQTNLTQNTYLWETESVQTGVYLVMIKANNELFDAQKVIINRQ